MKKKKELAKLILFLSEKDKDVVLDALHHRAVQAREIAAQMRKLNDKSAERLAHCFTEVADNAANLYERII